MFRRLDRYVLAEILGPMVLGLVVYTFILLLQVLFKSAALIIGSGVATATVGKLLALSLPSIVVLTIPMSLLFGILIAVGRLSSDSELVALRACGVSLFSLYRPILLLSAALCGLNAYLIMAVLPGGNEALERLKVDIVTQSLTQEVEARVPYTEWRDRILYVFESPPTQSGWIGTVLGDALPVGENQMIVAARGRAISDEETGRVLLQLEDAFTHQVDFAHPERYNIGFHPEMELSLDSDPNPQAPISVKRSMRSMTLRELVGRSEDPSQPDFVRSLARVEAHKKLAIPVACLVFGLVALPLGFTNSRGGRSSGFALSIGVIMVYYVLLNWGEESARTGKIPAWIAMWMANAVLLVAGLVLLVRRNRDKTLALTRVSSWLAAHLWPRIQRRRAARAERRRQRRAELQAKRRRADLVIRVPQIQLRFPNYLDRYVLSIFLRVLVIAAFSGLLVYIVADLSDRMDEILQNHVTREVVLAYYQYKSFAIVYQIAPIIVLVATLITFGLLSRTNEIVACKALGISLFRLAVPVVLAAALIATLAGLFQSEVLAASNSRVAELESQIKGGKTQAQRLRHGDRRWLYSRTPSGQSYLYNYASFDEASQELRRLQVFRFDDLYRLTDRLYVDRARYEGDGWWVFQNGWTRRFEGLGVAEEQIFEDRRRERLPDPPEFFTGELRRPDEMRYGELRDYIRELRDLAGQQVPELEVALHNKIAYPVISLVMAVVALPFAFRLGRRGALYGVGLSLLLGIVLMIFLALFTALGEKAILPPPVAVWAPSTIFSFFSLYLFLGVRT